MWRDANDGSGSAAKRSSGRDVQSAVKQTAEIDDDRRDEIEAAKMSERKSMQRTEIGGDDQAPHSHSRA